MNSIDDDPTVATILRRLHDASDAEHDLVRTHLATEGFPTGYEETDSAARTFWRDKFVAIDRAKARFVYALCRASGARHIVEAGTAFGVSTIYLAAAVRDNGGGVVVTCEHEESKATAARRNFVDAGLADLIDLRVGDVRTECLHVEEPIDLLLLDIWAPVAADVLALVGLNIRRGGIVIADNTMRRERYAGVLAFLEDPVHGFTNQTVPFPGGLEFAVKVQ